MRSATEGLSVDQRPSRLPRTELPANHVGLIPQVGHLRWRQRGDEDPDPNAWIKVTEQEAGRNHLPITLVAIDPDGRAVGAVALGRIDAELDDSERRERFPDAGWPLTDPNKKACDRGRYV